ncbi:MAG: hypothetical protein ACI8S6_004240 [Myxococcota bacterium]|jgi:hypothetical protein
MILSTLTLLVSLMIAPASAESLGRDLNDQPVVLELAPHKTALVFWSLDCGDCGAQMTMLESQGVHLVAINTDSGASPSSLRAFSALHSISSPVISDADASLQRMFQLGEGVVVLNELGSLEARVSGSPMQALMLTQPASFQHEILASQ